MKQRIKDLAKKSLYAFGYYHAFRARRTPGEARLLVLIYHDILDDSRVADPAELDDESPAAHEFEAHLRVVTDHYPVLPLREAVERLQLGDLDSNTVSLTFDDGYETVCSVAFPLLKRFGISATVFLLTDWIGDGKPYWWPRVRSLIQRSAFAGVTREQIEETVGGAFAAYAGAPLGASARRQVARAVEWSFRSLREEDRDRRLAALEQLLFPAGGAPSPPRPLAWDQVRDMSAHGIDFEPHTCSHIDIRNERPEKIQEELASSRRVVEEQTGRKTAGFAYPYGKDIAAYAAVEWILREQGFAYAITAVNGVNSRNTRPFLLRRQSLPRTTSAALLHRSLILAFARAREERVAI